ncbi:AprI/Inh family metalloprotease inhibitor, partial [Bosea sp. (in: a-proteobacteria)]|uniref:AprI/Inh family metalloprotease inhibitor n=1 Tax=Bosea sp. (in: a-proteobacteria) TaxID=1871050 RepID=UPI0027346DFC
AARRPPSPAEMAATAAQRPTLVDPARAPDSGTLPGLYALMRQPGREACRLRLAASSGEAGTPSARVEGLCTDTGITIFDPVGWRYAGGRLTLVARKGHSVDLVFEAGVWRKDPAVGATLLLRKLQP